MRHLPRAMRFLVAITLCILSCRKGDTGATGPSGTNGSTMLSGHGAPLAASGAEGDFYLDTDAQILYGPKTGGTWGTGVQLKGNADVRSDTFSVGSGDWQYGDMYYVGTAPGLSTGFLSKSFVHRQAAITAGLLNTGMVQVYYTSEPNLNVNNWTALPYSFTTYGGYAFNYAVETDTGKVSLFFYFSKVSADPPDLQTYQMPGMKFRILMLSAKLIEERTKQNHLSNDAAED